MTDTLVRTHFPEDLQRHSLVYYDKDIGTVNQAVRMLYRVSNKALRYRQKIYLGNLGYDRAYEGLLHYVPSNGVLTIRFPSECTGIGRIKNSNGCKMVAYYRDTETGYLREIKVTSSTLLNARTTELVVYNQQLDTHLVVTFDVYMMKGLPRASL